MSDSHSPRLAAALRLTTRTTAFRAGLAILMLIALLPTRTSGQFPNCDCNTLWELCNSGQNNQSCGVWEANCMVSGYCDCMAQFDNNEAWCAQFCGSTFCACVSCVSNVTIEGGGSTAGGSVSLTAHAYGQDGQDHSSEGSWSWTLDNDSIGRLEAGGNGATFYPNGNPGSGWITATFFQSSCDPMSGSGEVSVTRTCPTVSLSLNGPDAVETNGTESYSISGYPGSLPEGTSCDQDNPNAGSVQYSDGACVFTASSAAGDETTITVTVHPPDGCPQSSAQKRVTVAGDCAPWRQNGPGTSPDATIDTRALVPTGRDGNIRSAVQAWKDAVPGKLSGLTAQNSSSPWVVRAFALDDGIDAEAYNLHFDIRPIVWTLSQSQQEYVLRHEVGHIVGLAHMPGSTQPAAA